MSRHGGRLVAGLLRGSWRPSPPPLELQAADLLPLLPLLGRQGSSGLAWARIRTTPLAAEPALAPLREAYRYYGLRVKVLETRLPEVVAYLREHGAEPVLGKGWAVGRLYPGRGHRPYGDLDLWVRPSDHHAAREALRTPGRPDAPVELHRSFKQLADQDPDALWRHARVEELDGAEIRTFGPEHHLRLVALHALRHGLARPLWLCDVAILLETLPPDFDWEVAMAGGAWYSDGVRCALGLARELLGVDLEGAGVPRKWREAPLPSWMVPAALEAFGARAHYMAPGTPDPGSTLLSPRALLRVARLRWANALEATSRRMAPWNDRPRLPTQLADYLLRGAGFLGRSPGYLFDLVTDRESRA